MKEDTLDGCLEMVKFSLEEKRVIKILLNSRVSLTAEKTMQEYQKKFNVKIGKKIYFVLKKLKEKNLVKKNDDGPLRTFFCDARMLKKGLESILEKDEKEFLNSILRKRKIVEGIGAN